MRRIVFLFLFRNRFFGITPGSLEPVISISKYLLLFCGPLLEGRSLKAAFGVLISHLRGPHGKGLFGGWGR